MKKEITLRRRMLKITRVIIISLKFKVVQTSRKARNNKIFDIIDKVI